MDQVVLCTSRQNQRRLGQMLACLNASDRINLFAKWKTSKSGKSDFWPRNQNFKELPKSESFSLKKVTSARGHPGTVTWEHGQLLIRMVDHLVSKQICRFF